MVRWAFRQPRPGARGSGFSAEPGGGRGEAGAGWSELGGFGGPQGGDGGDQALAALRCYVPGHQKLSKPGSSVWSGLWETLPPRTRVGDGRALQRAPLFRRRRMRLSPRRG